LFALKRTFVLGGLPALLFALVAGLIVWLIERRRGWRLWRIVLVEWLGLVLWSFVIEVRHFG